VTGLLASTGWWVPFVTALGVAAAAASTSYYATWRFKKADVNRANAFRAVDFLDEAEQLTSRSDLYDVAPGGGPAIAYRLLLQARARAEPLNDAELDDRFRAALSYNLDLQGWAPPPGRARHWLYTAIANVRLALVQHLYAPRLLPVAHKPAKRWFPTSKELNAMAQDPTGRDGNVRIDALVDWRAAQPPEV
jgi:hypothetical protein